MLRINNRIWRKGLVCKASSVASNQTRWYNKRILVKGYSVPRDFSWIENYNLNTWVYLLRCMVAHCFQIKFEYQRKFKPHLNFIKEMKINMTWTWRCWHFWLISKTELICTLTCTLFFIYCFSWILSLIFRFDLMKIFLFWKGNLKPNGSNGCD